MRKKNASINPWDKLCLSELVKAEGTKKTGLASMNREKMRKRGAEKVEVVGRGP